MMMNRKQIMEDFKAVVDTLESDKKELEDRLNAARRDYYEAKRDFERNEKPTPAMLAALEALAKEGARFVDYDHMRQGHHSYYVQDAEGETAYWCPRYTVFTGLLSRGAMDGGERDDDVFKRVYTITEHGREILAKHGKPSKAGERAAEGLKK